MIYLGTRINYGMKGCGLSSCRSAVTADAFGAGSRAVTARSN